MRKICVVITARPSYSRIKTALEAINSDPKLKLQLVVCASALLDRYGSVINTIERDGFTVDSRVYMVLEGENPNAMSKTTGIGILELSTVFDNLKPDAVVVVADRFETIAVSIAAAYQNIPLVHIQGGEVTGNIDEKVRHANTKLADIHLVASEDAKQRIIKMGEDPEYVINTGCPSIDIAKIVSEKEQPLFDVYKEYGGVGSQPPYREHGYFVVMQHPVTTEFKESRHQIEETLFAIKDIQQSVFWFWPNVDAGADGTSTGIRSFRERFNLPHIHFFKQMEPEDFLKLLIHSKALIGNSSAGIRECSFLGVPAINIGSRQNRRMRGDNVLDVTYDRHAINNAINQTLSSPKPPSSPIYGNGMAGKNIANILRTIPLRSHKTIAY